MGKKEENIGIRELIYEEWTELSYEKVWENKVSNINMVNREIKKKQK